MLFELDLSGAEWVVTSYLCRDERRLDIVRSGKSPHVTTGAIVFGPSEDLVIAEHKAAKDISNPDDLLKLRQERFPELLKFPHIPRTKTVRQAGKGCNFQLDYREGYRSYALVNEMDEREAKRQIQYYRHVAYPGLLKWYESIDKEVRDTRTLTNCFGRRIYMQGALDDDTFRQATTFKSQSSVFDVTSHAMALLMDDEDIVLEPTMVQVHDSIMTQPLPQFERDFHAQARSIIKLGLEYLSPTLDYGEPFVLGVNLKVGPNWGALTELPLTRDADALARDLERVWHGARGRLG